MKKGLYSIRLREDRKPELVLEEDEKPDFCLREDGKPDFVLEKIESLALS